MNKKKISSWLKRITHIGALTPFLILIWDFYTNNLTINPIQEATHRTGKTALILLVLSLAVTPVMVLTKFRVLAPTRRLLGVYAFAYALLHVVIFVGIDYGLNWAVVIETMLQKQYTLVGLITFTLMVPLAITSTNGWQKRLGKKWKTLHKLAYLIGPLAVLHYSWAVKADIRLPLTFGAFIIILLLLRFPQIKQIFSKKTTDHGRNLKARTTHSS